MSIASCFVLNNVVRTSSAIALVVLCATSASAAPNCTALDREAKQSEITIPGCKAVHEVVGEGRLQFHSAPDASCKMPGVFVIPGQSLVAYSELKGYTSVMYINTKTGDTQEGWVSTARLKATGTGISPCQ